MCYSTNCCANCVYWECYDEKKLKIHGGATEGECHRYPVDVPVIETPNGEDVLIKDAMLCIVRGMPLMSHPVAYAEDWCGEFICVENPIVYDDEYDEYEGEEENLVA